MREDDDLIQGEDPPIFIPSEEESWELMRQQLDARLPVDLPVQVRTGRWAALPLVAAAAVVAIVSVGVLWWLRRESPARLPRRAAPGAVVAGRGPAAPGGVGAPDRSREHDHRDVAASGHDPGTMETAADAAPTAITLHMQQALPDEASPARPIPTVLPLFPKVAGGTADQGKHSAGKTRLSNPVLSAGLSLRQGFPLGSQRSVSYGAGGKPGILADYIPGVYAKVQPGDRMYLTAGLRVNSPQYTASSIVDRQADSSKLPGWQQDTQVTTVTLKKLYYVDVPLSVHYRLLSNLWLGAGAQYSRLYGGAADQTIMMYPTGPVRSNDPALFSDGYVALKDNGEAYAKIRKTDWRALLDASYGWRRWTLEMEYQWGLGSYMVSPAGKTRNTSLGLNLRYDLWRRHQ